MVKVKRQTNEKHKWGKMSSIGLLGSKCRLEKRTSTDVTPWRPFDLWEDFELAIPFSQCPYNLLKAVKSASPLLSITVF